MSNQSGPRPQQEFRDLLKSRGLKVTSARLAVLAVLSRASMPLTHAQVLDELHEQAIDQSTIFRNLKDLSEVGLVSRTELGDHMWRFELIRGEQSPNHPHFVCTACGKVTCLASRELNLANDFLDGVGSVSQVLLKGECLTCAAES